MTALPEVELESGTVVLCDLHLDLAHENPSPEFERVLESLRGVPRLVILGDLFDYWVGPAQLGLAGAPRILDAMAELAASGTQLDILFGNRDFLLESRFVERTGATLFPEGMVGLVNGGERSLLIHGDQLCTLDHGYLRLRRFLRSAPIRQIAPRLPLFLSQGLARRLRRASTAALVIKPIEEKSMQRSACEQFASEHRSNVVICGHAHAFRDERIAGDTRWIVLDAFNGQKDMLVLGDAGWEVRCSGEGVRIPRS